jgi:hypothetical protein
MMRRRTERYVKENNPFALIKVFFPKGTEDILREKSKASGLPMSRLIAIAVDNELDTPVPFNYQCELPSSVFVEFAYAEEAQKIARFLLRFPSGTGRDTLMLCRRDIGVPDRATFMYAYRELLQADMIEEFKPGGRVKFEYPEGYKYTRLKNRLKPMEKSK